MGGESGDLRSFYGSSTQVHLGPGPHVDPEHAADLRPARSSACCGRWGRGGVGRRRGCPVRPLAGLQLPDAPDDETRRAMRVERDEMVIETIADYNPQAVVCCGVPFGHTCPQWILPYGGRVTVDGAARTVEADYS